MDNNTMSLLVTVILVLIMFVVLFWFGMSLTVLMRLRNQYDKDSRSLKELQEGNKDKVLDNSKQLLEFIRMMVGQVAVLKFRTFMDTRDIEKSTKSNIEGLVKEVATTVNASLNMSNISIENTIYSKEFFEQYIVETSVIIVKDLLDKSLNDDEDQ